MDVKYTRGRMRIIIFMSRAFIAHHACCIRSRRRSWLSPLCARLAGRRTGRRCADNGDGIIWRQNLLCIGKEA
jgi:hypothetical protein